VTRFCDEHIILDPRASPAFGNIYARLDRYHHAWLEDRRFSGKDQETRIMITEPDVVAGVMSKVR